MRCLLTGDKHRIDGLDLLSLWNRVDCWGGWCRGNHPGAICLEEITLA